MSQPAVEQLVRPMPWTRGDLESLLTHEWLVTNGLGGYASGTVAGVSTRRYHGLLIAALPDPLGRTVMFNHLFEELTLADGTTIPLGSEEHAGEHQDLAVARILDSFQLEAGLPVWCYRIGSDILEKRLLLPHRQNTVHIHYRLLSGKQPVQLRLRPSVHFRRHEAAVNETLNRPYVLTAVEGRYEISNPSRDMPPLRFYVHGERPTFTVDGKEISQILYRIEESRGYEYTGSLWSPGHFHVEIDRGHPATLVASVEPWESVLALSPDEALDAARERRRRLLLAAMPSAHAGPAAELVLAADQFIICPRGRVEDAARAEAAGDEVRTVIAGYHWFTDWGRDTMISLEGLTLATGRHLEARYILHTFAHYIRDGLIPNLFPEGKHEGLYHTADATLWFFHALGRYVAITNDRETLRRLLPKLTDIIECHRKGTRFNIRVDPKDGLLHQGQEGYQLTWMDAKVDGWVVTPRRGKAVEINALWYNALRLMENWLRSENNAEAAGRLADYAEQVRVSFNQRFWYAKGGYLYDVVDGEKGDDPSCRPNQVLALSLDHPVLEQSRWKPVLDVVQARLLTPVGLRSLAPGSPDYRPKYYGDLRSRDAAYHQGTVWAWLMGPFIDAWQRVHPDKAAEAHHFLEGFVRELSDACLGTISEIFDADAPFTPRGCVAQAWSVAEVLRSWIKTTKSK